MSEPLEATDALTSGNGMQAHSQASNRLSIARLLLWTTATAVLFAAFRPAFVPPVISKSANEQFRQRLGRSQGPTRQQIERQQRVAQTMLAVITPFWGAALSGLALAVWRGIQPGPPFPEQPGHWLLVVVGGGVLALLAVVLLRILLLSAVPRQIDQSNELILIAVCGLLLIPAVLLLAAAINMQVQGPVQWRIVFWLPVAGMGSIAIGILLSFVSPPSPHFLLPLLLGLLLLLIAPIALVVAVITDIVSQAPLDSLHWSGVAVAIAHLVVPICLVILNVVGA